MYFVVRPYLHNRIVFSFLKVCTYLNHAVAACKSVNVREIAGGLWTSLCSTQLPRYLATSFEHPVHSCTFGSAALYARLRIRHHKIIGQRIV
jgi:hypothetical protein